MFIYRFTQKKKQGFYLMKLLVFTLNWTPVLVQVLWTFMEHCLVCYLGGLLGLIKWTGPHDSAFSHLFMVLRSMPLPIDKGLPGDDIQMDPSFEVGLFLCLSRKQWFTYTSRSPHWLQLYSATLIQYPTFPF